VRSTAATAARSRADVFIIQTHCGPVNDSLMEQLIMIDAAKRHRRSASPRCALLRLLRQDRKSTGREPITAKLVADMLSTAGADACQRRPALGAIQGFFDVPSTTDRGPVLEATSSPNRPDIVVVAPDAAG